MLARGSGNVIKIACPGKVVKLELREKLQSIVLSSNTPKYIEIVEQKN